MGIVEQLPAAKPAYSPPRPIEAGDRLEDFSCGKPALDDFLKQRALKNEGKAGRTFVVRAEAGEDAGRIVAYYTLSTGAVMRDDAPGWAKRNMPNPVPTFVLQRLAVSSNHQGKGLGKAMMREVFQRTLEASRHAGAMALVVHAKDDEAINFYTPYGFQVFPTDGRTLFLAIETIAGSL